jgi:hypothetical protein
MDNQHEDSKCSIKTGLFCPLLYEAAKAIIEALDDEVQSQLEYDEMRLSEDLAAAKEDRLFLLQFSRDKDFLR